MKSQPNGSSDKDLPLAGLRVVEFSQMVMGPCAGLILADLGAEVIKVEPLPKGDRTRYLPGLAAGFFTAFNRNKKSIALDMKSEEGMKVAIRLIASSDIMIENFRPGMMKGLGLDYETLSRSNERLIYCSLKGFLPGPYERRTALDEVVQMMAGLAFMTGLPGRPMRAGASVNDIMGAMFGVIGIQSALRERDRTGKGQEIQSGLFENNAFLMAQAMLAEAITEEPAQPWSAKERPWPVYDLFDTADGTKLFVGIVGDGQWKDFCRTFGKTEWLEDPRLQTNADRSAARSWLLPVIAEIVRLQPLDELMSALERLGLPFAPVRRPGELADDVHLIKSGGLIDVELPDGRRAKTPLLPFTMGGRRVAALRDPPAIGADTRDVLKNLRLGADEIEKLVAGGVVGTEPKRPASKADDEARCVRTPVNTWA
jgi:crotonobetainyl-CoA:carnitine CoA-transferase CaiB-like acyl-CoA transferase